MTTTSPMRRQSGTASLSRSLITVASSMLITFVLLSTPAAADDTEVFFGQVSKSSSINPNVLFVLDTSGSMNWFDGGSRSRLRRMKDALGEIIGQSRNLNVGVMRFNGSYGGGSVIYPVRALDAPLCEGAACISTIDITKRLDEGSNDIEEHVPTGEIEDDGPDSGKVLSIRSGTDPRLVGVRFPELNIPQGATITQASLRFTAWSDRSGDADFEVKTENVDDSAPLELTDFNLSSRDQSTATASWQPEDWTAQQDYATDDLSSIVQEIVDRDGWCGGNAMTFVLSALPDSAERETYSFDSGPGFAPTLNVSYDPASIPAGGGCGRNTTVSKVDTGNGDATEFEYNGKNSRSKNYLRIPRDVAGKKGLKDVLTGIRFTDLEIPQGATIESAKVEFKVRKRQYGSPEIEIRAQNSGNSPTISGSRYDLTNRTNLTSVVDWSPENPNTGAQLSTPELKDIVQEIVDRSDWSGGNAMTLILNSSGGDGYRELQSYDGDAANAPRLVVTYRSTQAALTAAAPKLARDEIIDVIENMTAKSGTPIVGAYYEATNYLLGRPVEYGQQRGHDGLIVSSDYNNNQTYNYRNQYHRVSHPASYTGAAATRPSGCTDENLDSWNCRDEQIDDESATYISPMNASCQSNHVVFLSDGEATTNHANARIENLIGKSCEEHDDNGWQTCGRELATWLVETDHDSAQSQKQNIHTYTIGFNTDGAPEADALLSDLARNGGGRFFKAESSAQLVDVFKNILGDVDAVDTTFVAPGATVNQFNRLTHRGDIYFAMFKPNNRASWTGNMKRYKIGKSAGGGVKILDSNDLVAVDPDTGFFSDSAVSEWNGTLIDGSDVALGGIAQQLGNRDDSDSDSKRRTFTYVGTLPVAAEQADLTLASNSLSDANDAITEEMLGIDFSSGTETERSDYRSTLLEWARGIDVRDEDGDGDLTDYRPFVGDPMHSRPVILNYRDGSDASSTVFVATNEGYVHAIDSDTGKERYAFMPKELLSNLDTLYTNQSGVNAHPYGLDGALTAWSPDPEKDVTIDEANGEEAWLYVGMRRGGSNLYALDVSDRNDPELGWVIEGGTGDFAQLGQTWSQAKSARMMINNTIRDVLVFGAGYDEANDIDPSDLDATDPLRLARQEDTVGRGLYIVDARTGERLWAGVGVAESDAKHFPAMKYSMPGDIRVIDVNQDGLADQFYAGDMGGQIWRFDVTQYHKSPTDPLVKGGVIADLGGNALKDRRKFFYEPDVALIARDGERFLSLSIGSGWRAHPLDTTIDDRFYSLRMDSIERAPEGYGKKTGIGMLAVWSPLTETDLINVTDDQNPTINDRGWYIEMEGNGQKVLAESITVNNQLVFTAYRPELTLDACSTAIGSSLVFVVDVLDGAATLNLDKTSDGDLDKKDRERVLTRGGIASEAAALITENGDVITVGPDQPLDEFDFGNLTQRTYWLDRNREAGSSGVSLSEVDE